jgi:hypothetical protein
MVLINTGGLFRFGPAGPARRWLWAGVLSFPCYIPRASINAE